MFEKWVNGLKKAISSPVLEMLPECHSGAEVIPSQCQRQQRQFCNARQEPWGSVLKWMFRGSPGQGKWL